MSASKKLGFAGLATIASAALLHEAFPFSFRMKPNRPPSRRNPLDSAGRFLDVVTAIEIVRPTPKIGDYAADIDPIYGISSLPDWNAGMTTVILPARTIVAHTDTRTTGSVELSSGTLTTIGRTADLFTQKHFISSLIIALLAGALAVYACILSSWQSISAHLELGLAVVNLNRVPLLVRQDKTHRTKVTDPERPFAGAEIKGGAGGIENQHLATQLDASRADAAEDKATSQARWDIIQGFEREIYGLRGQVTTLETDLSTARHQNKIARKKLWDSRYQLVASQVQITKPIVVSRDRQAAIRGSEGQIREPQGQSSFLDVDLASARQQNHTVSQVVDLQRQLTISRRHVANLNIASRARKATIQSSAGQIRQLQEQISALEDDLALSHRQNHTAVTNVGDLQHQLAACTTEVANLNSVSRVSQAIIQGLAQRINDQDAHLAAAREEIIRLNETSDTNLRFWGSILVQDTAEVLQSSRRLQRRNEKQKRALQKQGIRIGVMRKTLRDTRNELEDTEAQLEDREALIGFLTEEVRRLSGSQSQILRLRERGKSEGQLLRRLSEENRRLRVSKQHQTRCLAEQNLRTRQADEVRRLEDENRRLRLFQQSQIRHLVEVDNDKREVHEAETRRLEEENRRLYLFQQGQVRRMAEDKDRQSEAHQALIRRLELENEGLRHIQQHQRQLQAAEIDHVKRQNESLIAENRRLAAKLAERPLPEPMLAGVQDDPEVTSQIAQPALDATAGGSESETTPHPILKAAMQGSSSFGDVVRLAGIARKRLERMSDRAISLQPRVLHSRTRLPPFGIMPSQRALIDLSGRAASSPAAEIARNTDANADIQ